jgi:hypothetical protein
MAYPKNKSLIVVVVLVIRSKTIYNNSLRDRKSGNRAHLAKLEKLKAKISQTIE